MKYHDLRDFMAQLERTGELKRVGVEVDTRLEMTEICDRVLRAAGPAILFEKPKGHTIPVLANLFGTPKRVALGMGEESVQALREVGKLLAYLKEPEPPRLLAYLKEPEPPKAEGRLGQAADPQAGHEHGAENGVDRALPGNRLGRARMLIWPGCRSSTAGRATSRR